jgi:hypothetical protein
MNGRWHILTEQKNSTREALSAVAASPAKYKNEPVEFLFQPFFMTPYSGKVWKKAVHDDANN